LGGSLGQFEIVVLVCGTGDADEKFKTVNRMFEVNFISLQLGFHRNEDSVILLILALVVLLKVWALVRLVGKESVVHARCKLWAVRLLARGQHSRLKGLRPTDERSDSNTTENEHE